VADPSDAENRFDLFVSYSRKDSHLVDGLVKVLRLTGRTVFVDNDSIEAGSIWEDTLRHAVSKAEQIVLFWCCHSSGSKWVAAEIAQAIDEKKPIVPLLLCDEPVPKPVAKYQWIDLQLGVKHPCKHPRSQANVAATPANFLMPFKPDPPHGGTLGQFTADDPSERTLHPSQFIAYRPHEYAQVFMSDPMLRREMVSLAPEALAVCGTVFRILELQDRGEWKASTG
jgi:hypothetical protein